MKIDSENSQTQNSKPDLDLDPTVPNEGLNLGSGVVR